MALDETAHAALRQLRVRSSPMAEDRARIKAKLAPLLIAAPLSGAALSSPPSTATSPIDPARHGTGTGAIDPVDPGLMTTAEAGVASGGLGATLGLKLGVVALCTVLAAAAWVGVTHRGASRAPGVDSVSQRNTVPIAAAVQGVETALSRSSPLSASTAIREPLEQGLERSTTAGVPDRSALDGAKPTRRAAAVRTKAASVPAREALQAEIEALRVAQEALRDGDPQAALRTLEQREKSAQLARDREGLRAVALCDAKRGEAGRASAEQFLRRHSSSALARRVRSACAKYLVPSSLPKQHQ